MTPEEFKEKRLKLGYETRGDLAEAMGITRYAIEHYEYGRRPIPKWAQKLLECLRLAQLVEQKRQDGNSLPSGHGGRGS